MRYSVIVDTPLLAWQSLELDAPLHCTGNDFISMAASKLNIANEIIITIRYELTNKMLSRSKALGNQLPAGNVEGAPVQMRLTLSADAEGFWTISPPEQFVRHGYVSPQNSPRMDLDSDIDAITKDYDDQRIRVPAMSESESIRKGLTSGIKCQGMTDRGPTHGTKRDVTWHTGGQQMVNKGHTHGTRRPNTWHTDVQHVAKWGPTHGKRRLNKATHGTQRAITEHTGGQHMVHRGQHMAHRGVCHGTQLGNTWHTGGHHMAHRGVSSGTHRDLTWHTAGQRMVNKGPAHGTQLQGGNTWHAGGHH